MDKLNIIKRHKEKQSLYNFKRLITKYSKGEVYATIETDGYYDQEDGGKYKASETIYKLLVPAAIVPMNKDDLRYSEGGHYNEDNRKLYCYERLIKGSKITNIMTDGTTRNYTILSDGDYSDYDTGLHIYILGRGDQIDIE